MFKQARRIAFSMLFLETEGRCWCKIQPRGMQWKCDRQKNKKKHTILLVSTATMLFALPPGRHYGTARSETDDENPPGL